ncbi:hypothetical protein MUK42_00979 [Musa troglodytarum]|uniref:PTB domain-containing engulfment adapter protein 1 n=1 Tax=Musa troglodytarum TaxID=320322 RepID=A0A9E7FEU5_9LILI|nr:hypothetical protein MUK42_00979 [Musa troglodytarum]
MASASFSVSARLPTASLPSPKEQGRGRAAVYVAAVPLRAAKGPAQMLMSAAYSLGVWDLQHFMVVVRPDPSQSQVIVFDFQPQDPENFYTLLSVLLQRQIPGVVLKRKLRRIPKSRCWFIGFSDDDGVEVANKFSEDWSTHLTVGKHDCRNFTNGLVECLTGQQHVLSYLQAISSG